MADKGKRPVGPPGSPKPGKQGAPSKPPKSPRGLPKPGHPRQAALNRLAKRPPPRPPPSRGDGESDEEEIERSDYHGIGTKASREWRERARHERHLDYAGEVYNRMVYLKPALRDLGKMLVTFLGPSKLSESNATRETEIMDQMQIIIESIDPGDIFTAVGIPEQFGEPADMVDSWLALFGNQGPAGLRHMLTTPRSSGTPGLVGPPPAWDPIDSDDDFDDTDDDATDPDAWTSDDEWTTDEN